MTALTHPTVHLNGSPRERLLDGYVTAMQAVEAAIDAVQATGPNGRDYYVQSPTAITLATAQHHERLRLLNAVVLQLTELAERLAGH